MMNPTLLSLYITFLTFGTIVHTIPLDLGSSNQVIPIDDVACDSIEGFAVNVGTFKQ